MTRKTPAETIAKAPTYFRATKASGNAPASIDPEGGYRNAGIIRGVSVITRGEALGHDVWIDNHFLNEVADAINALSQGVKSRFTHPGISSDGLGRHTGRVMDAKFEGDRVLADQHFAASAHDTPNGDLAGYLLNLAADDPEAYGLSIVFEQDPEAMDEFLLANQSRGRFESPDPFNKKNLPHVRLKKIRAADAVDEPAANPGGLFHRENEIYDEAAAIASFALGISDEAPTELSLGVDPVRTRGFIERFFQTHNLEVVEMGSKNETEINEVENLELDSNETETNEVETNETEQTAGEPAVELSDGVTEARRFQEAFGDKGPVWYAEGLSFEAARNRQFAELSNSLKEKDEKIAELKTKLSASKAIDGEDSPVELATTEGETKGKGFASKIKIK